MNTIAIVSGGLDSTILAYKLAAEGSLRALVSFDYGQRHRTELTYAAETAKRLGVEHILVDLKSITAALSGTALTDASVPVPEGHYAEESMRQTVVPNRNAIMLSIAAGIAASKGCGWVATGVHAGDHFIYPDCRPEFIESFDAMLRASFGEMFQTRLEAPFVRLTKADIVKLGAELNVPFEATWSCYKGGAVHCGKCGTCVERREAFYIAEVADPTFYADPDYWRSVCHR